MPNLSSQTFSPRFSFGSFIVGVLYLGLWSVLIYLLIFCVYGVRYGPKLTLYIWCPVLPALFLDKAILFPTALPLNFLKTQLIIYVWVYFWTLFCVELCVCPLPLLYCHFCTFIILLKSDSVIFFFSNLFLSRLFGYSKSSAYPYKF